MLDLNHWRNLLQREADQLEEQLGGVGRAVPNHPGEWEATPLEAHDTSFRDEVADDLEELEEREEVELALEKRLKQVRAALARLDAGTYGRCEIGGEEIEAERLEANPTARTCKTHLDQEVSLL